MRRQVVFDHTGCLEILDLRLSLSTAGVPVNQITPTAGIVCFVDDPIPDPEPSAGTLPTDPTTTPTAPTSGPVGPGTS